MTQSHLPCRKLTSPDLNTDRGKDFFEYQCTISDNKKGKEKSLGTWIITTDVLEKFFLLIPSRIFPAFLLIETFWILSCTSFATKSKSPAMESVTVIFVYRRFSLIVFLSLVGFLETPGIHSSVCVYAMTRVSSWPLSFVEWSVMFLTRLKCLSDLGVCSLHLRACLTSSFSLYRILGSWSHTVRVPRTLKPCPENL